MANVPESIALAIKHHESGRLPEAEALCRQILQVAPGHPDALHVLGVVAMDSGRNDQAVEYLEQALGSRPSAAEIHNSLAESLRLQGLFDRAESHYQQALAINPSMAEAHSNLGIVLQKRGRYDDAVAHLRQALQAKPSYAVAHSNLGSVYLEQGRFEEAIAECGRALSIMPDLIDARMTLAVALRTNGRTLDAVRVLFEGTERQPVNPQLRGALGEFLRGVALATVGDRERAILADLCVDDDISKMHVSLAVMGLLRNSSALPALLQCVRSCADLLAAASRQAIEFTRDQLLLAALPRIVILDADVELVLTGLRRSILLWTQDQDNRPPTQPGLSTEFVCALARQCFLAEYALFVGADEQPGIKWVEARVQVALKKPIAEPRALEHLLVAAALYGPLNRFTGWERLLGPTFTSWSASFQPIIREQLINRRREKEIEGNLAAVTAISDGVSKAVRQQYEDNPYPRWVSVSRPKPVTVAEFAQRLRPGAQLPPVPSPVPILVAGCGTGHHPIDVARKYRDCEILAIDLSRASLAYGARMAEQLQIANIAFQQADILELGGLDRRFYIIECGGVLHHLRHPLEGWRILVGLLQPGGLMKIGLYSKTARRSIPAAHEFVRRGGFEATPDGIRRCRRAIIDLPEGDPVRDATSFGDFFSLNGCRDLLMHVQEHVVTLPLIEQYLDELGLRFVGMETESWAVSKFQMMRKQQGTLADLALWNLVEQAHPDTFKNMYQFWCCAK